MTIIATWKMALNGAKLAREAILDGAPLEEALITLIKDVELNEDFHSVGYSGLPNEDGVVECDERKIYRSHIDIGPLYEKDGPRRRLATCGSGPICGQRSGRRSCNRRRRRHN